MTDQNIDVTVWQHISGSTWGDVGSLEAWSSSAWETRHLQEGPWAMSLPLNAQTLRFAAPDAKKYLLTHSFRGVETTGLIEHIGSSQPDAGGIGIDLAGVDAMALLGDPLCWPNPTAPLDAQDTARYEASGVTETVLRDLIAAQIGRLYGGAHYEMTVPASLGRGGQTSVSLRMHNLFARVAGHCETAGLGVRVGLTRNSPTSTRATLGCEFYVPQDRSQRVYLSHDVGTLRTWSQSDDAPTATRVVIGGGGTGTDRVFRQLTATTAEAEWGRRREVFSDARDTTDTAELDARGTEELTDAAAQSSFDLEALDAEGMRYGEHFAVGDSVTVELVTGVSKVDRLNAVIVTSDNTGVKVQLRPGNPDVEPLFKQAALIRGLRQRVRDLQLEELA